MSPETQARIFEPFYTTKSAGHGSGLGLSTVYGIVRNMRGEIHVESKPGHGSSFWVWFPAAGEPISTKSVAAVPSSEALVGKETVLVVEDDEHLLTVIVETLEHYGYGVLGAASGIEALILSEQSDAPIDLAVVDVIMPLVGGEDLVECLRQVRPGLKVVFVSSSPQVIVKDIPGTVSDDAFVQKPFKPDDLVARIRKLLDTTESSALVEATQHPSFGDWVRGGCALPGQTPARARAPRSAAEDEGEPPVSGGQHEE